MREHKGGKGQTYGFKILFNYWFYMISLSFCFIVQTMIKIKATYAKEKGNVKEFECENFLALREQLSSQFAIDLVSIKFMKPPIKDQASFQKAIKNNALDIMFTGSKKKDEVEEKKELPKSQGAKIEQSVEKTQTEKGQTGEKKKEKKEKNEEDIRARVDPRYRAQRDHERRKVQERGLLYFDEDKNDAEDIGTDHITSVAHLFRVIPDVKNFCYGYEVRQRHPSGLFIDQTRNLFKYIDGDTGEIGNPVIWAISFMIHCADLIEENFPVYDFHYIVIRMIDVINQNQKRSDPNYKPEPKPLKNKEDPNEDKTLTEVRKWFGIYISQKTKEEDKGEFDFEDDDEFNPQKRKQAKKQFLRYVLECDISQDSKAHSLQRSIQNMFDSIYNNIAMIRQPKFLFIHLNRMGYPPPEEPDIWLENYDETKLKYRPKTDKKFIVPDLKIPEVLDTNDLCTKNQRDKNGQGRVNRAETFHPLKSYSRPDDKYGQISFENFKKELEQKRKFALKYYTEEELLYMFFEKWFLFDEEDPEDDIFDEFYFQPEPKLKPTGEFRLMGVIFHKGDYYHEITEEHNMQDHNHTSDQCKGETMAIVYKKNRTWIKFLRQSAFEISLEEVQDLIYLKTKQGKSKQPSYQKWTPSMLLYRQICPPKSFNILAK